MNQPSQPPSTGLVAGKYQLVTMIGRGGMGSVWEARHASLGTRFAIKFIESEYADSQEARKRFDNEAKAAATIQSKHAIQIYDHGVTDDGKPYIVMELLVGQPLDKRIDQRGSITLQETATILQQVCRGLARLGQLEVAGGARHAEVEELDLPRVPVDEHDVRRLEIAMNDAARVRVREALERLQDVVDDQPSRQCAAGISDLAEIGALEQLHHDER